MVQHRDSHSDSDRFVGAAMIAEAQMDPELQAHNASALGKALFFSCVIPTLLSAWGLKVELEIDQSLFLIFKYVYWTTVLLCNLLQSCCSEL